MRFVINLKFKVDNDQVKDIIKNCVAGKRAAQKQLFELFYGTMLGVCMRYTKDKDAAQEVVQEGFIKVFEKLNEFDFTGSFEGWMRRIMVNTSIDAIRKKKRRAFATDEDFILEQNPLYTDDKDDDKFLNELKAEEAMKAIQELSPAYQTVFNLYVIENYSHKEIAEILEITEGSSKSNLAKAKQNLRKILKEKFEKIDRNYR